MADFGVGAGGAVVGLHQRSASGRDGVLGAVDPGK